jgi:hypothetical protein
MVIRILFRIIKRCLPGRFIPDRIYLLMLYRISMHRWLDLQNPRAFTEKIQWLKLNWRHDILTKCTDKYEVRKFVEDRIGPESLKKLYGVYKKPEEIDLGGLPDAFVLKVNHGCRQNIFCEKKSEIDWNYTVRLLKKYLKENLYPKCREWAYENIAPRIICEEHLAKNGETLYEYGFYCYGGVPRLVEINEYSPGLKRVNMFDIDLRLMENEYMDAPLSQPVSRDRQYEKMLEYAAVLSEGFPFVRVDLIRVNDRICFGEMTFYPLAGLSWIAPESFNYFLGSYLHLPVLPPQK